MPKAHVSTNEILDAVNNFSNVMEKHLQAIEFRMDHDMATKQDLAALETRVNKKFEEVNSNMDAIAKTVKDTREEVSAWHGPADRTEQQVATHEKKIGAMQMHFGIKFE